MLILSIALECYSNFIGNISKNNKPVTMTLNIWKIFMYLSTKCKYFLILWFSTMCFVVSSNHQNNLLAIFYGLHCHLVFTCNNLWLSIWICHFPVKKKILRTTAHTCVCVSICVCMYIIFIHYGKIMNTGLTRIYLKYTK